MTDPYAQAIAAGTAILDCKLDGRALTTVRVPELIEQAFGVSRSQARKWIKEGAFKIEGEPYTHLTCAVSDVEGKAVQVGRRRWARIQINVREA